MRSIVTTLVLALAVASAAGASAAESVPGNASAVQTAAGTNAPPGSAAVRTNAARPPHIITGCGLDDSYRLRGGDRIGFQIIEEGSPAQFLTIAQSGDVDIPRIGPVAAVDKTCEQLAAQCKTELAKKSGVGATVIVARETNQFRGEVWVLGEVKEQGVIYLFANFNENLTLSQAILRAGGFTDFAGRTIVKLVRWTNTITVNVDLIRKGQADKDAVVAPGDRIFVPFRYPRPNY
jgi:protein involved in polysaccharide export with SLBB domain